MLGRGEEAVTSCSIRAGRVDITEVRIKLMEESEDRLRAFCSITIDNAFVVRDLKIIEGPSGPFVAMPSRKLTNRCGRCGHKNHVRSNYCNNCGSKVRRFDPRSDDTPGKLYADVAHPINQACRDQIQQSVVSEYLLELERIKQPGYVSRYDDSYDAGDDIGESTLGPGRPHFMDRPKGSFDASMVERRDDEDASGELRP